MDFNRNIKMNEDLIRIYVCQHCNTVGLQGVDENFACRRCSKEDVDWYNVEFDKLKEDFKFMNNILSMRTMGYMDEKD